MKNFFALFCRFIDRFTCALVSPFLLAVDFGRVSSLINLWTHSLLHQFLPCNGWIVCRHWNQSSFFPRFLTVICLMSFLQL